MSEALSAARGARDTKSEARALYLLGHSHNAGGEHRVALDHYQRASAVSRAAGDTFGEALALHNVAAQHWALGDAVQALELYRQVLPLRAAVNDRPGLAYTQYGIAASAWAMGDAAEALEAYREALEIWRALKDKRGEAETRNSMGLIFALLRDLGRAREEIGAALELFRALGNQPGEAYALNNLGLVAVGAREFRQAIQYCTRAFDILQTTSDRRGQAYALHTLGNAQAGLGDHQTAMKQYERSLSLKRELEDRWGEGYTLQAMAESHLARGESPAGRALLVEALSLRRAVHDRTGEIETLGVLADVQRKSGDLAGARTSIESAVDSIETVRSGLVSQDLRGSYFAGRRDYYEFLVDVLMRMGSEEAALEAAERARGRLLADRLADTLAGIRQGVDAGLAARLRAAQRGLNAQAARFQQIYGMRRTGDQVKAAEEELNRQIRRYRELQEEVRSSSPAYSALVEPPRMSAAQMRGLLGNDTALIQYFTGRDFGYVWVVTARGIQSGRIPARKELERLRLNRWQGDVSALTAPLRKLPVRRLVISADGPLEALPFASLPLPGSGEPLIARYEVVGLPSASALALLRQGPRPQASKAIAVLADPVYSADDPRVPEGRILTGASGLPRLRFTRTEAESIAALAPATVGLDLDASRAFLGKLNLAEYRALHFGAHAVLDEARPELSGIVLSDGILRLHEIYNLNLRARLVTLSACGTALGANLPGEGLLSLTRAFLYAGSAAVLATLWDVDDQASSELMDRLYRHFLRERLSPATSLRQAQLSIRSDPRWKDPYYWAGYTLQGEWR